jgi:hypothetical protein
MDMRRQVSLVVALLMIFAIPTTGLGWFHSLFSRSSYRAAPPIAVYYCPVPVVAAVPYPVVPAPYPEPVPVPPLRRYAEPRPAPPSGTPEPPRPPETKPKAGVNTQESRKVSEKFFDSYFVAGPTRTPGGDRCAVTFWNLAGQNLTLTVEGRAHLLPAGQSVRLDLKREFTWTVAGREAERQQVPAAESGVEIVVRRP